MKKDERFFSALNGIGEKYILEADPTKKKRLNIKKIAILAACFCLVFTSLNLWLFLPIKNIPKNISQYRESEYFTIIEKLNEFNTGVPKFKNNFSMISYALSNLSFGSVKGEGTNGVDGIDKNFPTYEGDIFEDSTAEDITDNQVSGVIETDIIKKSDKHIFYFYNGLLNVYDIAGKDSGIVASFSLNSLLEKDDSSYNDNASEFFLSDDYSTAIFIVDAWTKTQEGANSFIKVLALDVSDPEKGITLKNEFSITGLFTDARFTDGKLLLVSQFYVPKNADFSKEEEFLPQYDNGSGFMSVDLDDIIIPEKLTNSRYQVVSLLDINTLEFYDCTALLSYSTDLYVSRDAIYMTRQFTNETKDGNVISNKIMTEICGISYTGGKLEVIGKATVNGSVKDQYSLDEYEGILRVVTTTNIRSYNNSFFANVDGIITDAPTVSTETNANLYCIDLSNWSIRARVENFAPWGEDVKSVRFDKDSAYVCTAVTITLEDPVFFFDLSDLDNITYKDTGTIKGFSNSLVQFGDGFLLGIGRGDGDENLKIEIYEEAAEGVVSVCKYTANAYYSGEYKSYYINREKGLFGLGLVYYTPISEDRYVLLGFDGYELREILSVPIQTNPHFVRAVLIDDYFYIFDGLNFNVIEYR